MPVKCSELIFRKLDQENGSVYANELHFIRKISIIVPASECFSKHLGTLNSLPNCCRSYSP